MLRRGLLVGAGALLAAPRRLLAQSRASRLELLNGFPAPLLDFDFANGVYRQDGVGFSTTASNFITTSRASTGYADDTSGTWTSFGNNVPRITDKGLLVEEARTNSITNNSMGGAVAGSPGTLPTGWTSVIPAELTQTVVGTGTTQGIDYIDVRINGTVTASRNYQLRFQGTPGIAATPGQVWTLSFFINTAAGSVANIQALGVNVDYLTSFPAFISNFGQPIVITPTFTRNIAIGSGAPATTAWVRPYFNLTTMTSGVLDITVRIGWPQMELGAFATSPIRTTAGAVTRAADVVTATIAPTFGPAFSLFVEAMPNVPVSNTTNQQYLNVDDGTINERANIYRNAVSGAATGATQLIHGGVQTEFSQGTTWQTLASGKIAGAFETNNNAGAFNGSLNTPTILTEVIPTGLTTVHIGTRYDGAAAFANAYIRLIAIWPTTRLSNAALQRIVQ